MRQANRPPMQCRANWRGVFGGRDAIGQEVTGLLGHMTQGDLAMSREMTLLTDVTQPPVAA